MHAFQGSVSHRSMGPVSAITVGYAFHAPAASNEVRIRHEAPTRREQAPAPGAVKEEEKA